MNTEVIEAKMPMRSSKDGLCGAKSVWFARDDTMASGLNDIPVRHPFSTSLSSDQSNSSKSKHAVTYPWEPWRYQQTW